MEIRIPSKKQRINFSTGIFLRARVLQSLSFFLSGLSGGKDFSLFKNASLFFSKNGFSTLSFNFCADSAGNVADEDALRLNEFNFARYLVELKNVVDFFDEKYKKIIFVGHSFGAVVFTLFLDKYKKYLDNVELILWDPSLLPWKKEWMEADFVFDQSKGLYVERNGKEEISTQFYKECIDLENTANILAGLGKKVCIIAAGKGAHVDAKKYFLKISNKKASEFCVIEKAGHLFGGKMVQNTLFKKTLNFLDAVVKDRE